MKAKKEPKKQGTKKNAIPVPEKLNFLLPSLIALISFLIYFNTLHNGYVLDDSAAIERNQFVQKGFAGIMDILKVDLWHFKNLNLGYYRPLSLITFAIEHQFFGNNPFVSHFVNVLLYAFTGLMLCFLLRELFSGYHRMFPFLICLLFVAHPVHVEVVANIKSRDEILSFLGIVCVLFMMVRYDGMRKKIYLFISLIIFYLAMISKETAITLIALLPLMFYFFKQKTISEALIKTIPFVVIVLIFYIQKNAILGAGQQKIFPEIMNYPYANSKFSSSMVLFVHLIRLLFIPHPLRFDYSYNQIPSGSSSILIAVLGFALFGFLMYLTVKLALKKNVFGLSLAIFFITLLPALAFVWLRGGILAERFLYAATLGFCITIVYLIAKALKADIRMPALKTNQADGLAKTKFSFAMGDVRLVSIVAVISILYSFKTIDRNKAWKDNFTLFSTDIKTSPNNAQANRFYGGTLLDNAIAEKDSLSRIAHFNEALLHLNKAVEINPKYGEAWGDLGRAYTNFRWIPDSAIYFNRRSLEATPGNFFTMYNLALVYLTIGRAKLASYYFNEALRISPGFPEARQQNEMLKQKTGLDVHEYPGEQ